MALPQRVTIIEVGPRDGLQNEAAAVPLAARHALIDALADAGCRVIEAASFVSPRWVPQMADSAALMRALVRRPGIAYPVLVPNLRGLEEALDCGVREVAVFASASEAFSQKNINCSIAESLARFAPVVAAARSRGVAVRGYVSCVLGCPWQGAVSHEAVAQVAAALLALGCEEISLGDTIGAGTPSAAAAMTAQVMREVPAERIALHFHDTFGQALANIHACLPLGISRFDAAVAGLGGCPYAAGATGNVATEDLVYMLHGMGIATGIDPDRLVEAGAAICRVLGKPPASHLGALRHRRQA